MGIRIPAPVRLYVMPEGEGPLQVDVRDKTEVWLVGIRIPVVGPDRREMVDIEGKLVGWWEILGAFVAIGEKTGEEVALEAARTRGDKRIFIGPLPVNTLFPSDRCEWPGCYYPNYTEADRAAALNKTAEARGPDDVSELADDAGPDAAV